MFSITADSTASIRFSTHSYNDATTRDADVLQRYIRWFGKTERKLSDIKPESFLYKPRRLEPGWLSAVQQRIRMSIEPNDSELENDGQWLRQDVAEAAFDFFAAVADVLPEEPFIYRSNKGDLVAESKAVHGNLTVIVSPTFKMLFAVVDGEPVERKVSGAAEARATVKELAALLSAGHHGTVGPHK